jgi:hypothetical protein
MPINGYVRVEHKTGVIAQLTPNKQSTYQLKIRRRYATYSRREGEELGRNKEPVEKCNISVQQEEN